MLLTMNRFSYITLAPFEIYNFKIIKMYVYGYPANVMSLISNIVLLICKLTLCLCAYISQLFYTIPCYPSNFQVRLLAINFSLLHLHTQPAFHKIQKQYLTLFLNRFAKDCGHVPALKSVVLAFPSGE